MLGYQQEKLLYRILSGKTILNINKTRLDVHAPSLDLLYESCEIYENLINSSKVLSKQEMKEYLVFKKIITRKDVDFLEQFNRLLEEFQKDLYRYFFDDSLSKNLRNYIKKARKEQEKIFSIISKYDTYTKEGLANYAKSIFLISKTTYNKGKQYKFSNIRPIQVLSKMAECSISPEMIRSISKNTQWSNIWFSFKGTNIFPNGASSSIDQQLLMMWSRMYDGIRESIEAPIDEIIDDNDAIDGWMLLQKEKRIKEAKENKDKDDSFKGNSKINNSQEVFILAQNKNEIDKINEMNSDYAKRIKDNRFKQIVSAGTISHQQLADVKQEIMMQMVQQEVQSVKGR